MRVWKIASVEHARQNTTPPWRDRHSYQCPETLSKRFTPYQSCASSLSQLTIYSWKVCFFEEAQAQKYAQNGLCSGAVFFNRRETKYMPEYVLYTDKFFYILHSGITWGGNYVCRCSSPGRSNNC